MKKLFFTFLLCSCVGTALASVTIDSIAYNLNETELTAEVTYNGTNYYSGSVIIPESITYDTKIYSVTSIGSEAFANCTKLKSVAISNNITTIGTKAFIACKHLKSILIPSSVISIGEEAFTGCSSLNSTTISNGVTSIGKSAFSSCTALTSITLPNSITTIGSYAFEGCKSLASFSIPYSVTTVADCVFSGCTGLTSIEIPNSITSIGGGAFSGCAGLISVDLPNSVTSIGKSAFEYCKSLASFSIPNNVTKVENFTFGSCTSLKSVAIPNSVTSIGNKAFVGCDSLAFINVDNDNPKYCSIDGVLFNKDKTTLMLCPVGKRGEYIIPNNATSIGDNAFDNCTGLTSVIIPNSIISIGEYAFYYCVGLTSVTLSNSVTSIGSHAFQECNSLASFSIPNSVTTVADYAFSGCTGLKSIEIPYGIKSIGYYTFRHCTSLTSITIPNSVTSIGFNAFEDCTSLITIDVDEENPNYCSVNGVLFNKAQTTLCKYPGGIQGEYIIPNSVTRVGDEAFDACSGLSAVIIPNSVTSIGYRAFEYCSGLSSIEIPSSVTNIGDVAFYYCTGLTFIEIPNSVTSIGYYAFRDCTGLISITIGSGVKNIRYNAFEHCESLNSVTCKALTPPTMELLGNEGVFYRVDCSKIPLYVPAESISAYKAADQWKDFNPIRPIGYTEYTITFVNWDDSVLLELPIEEGVIPEYTGTTPIRPTDEDYTYTFSGWSPAIVAANHDTTYIAQYMAIPIGQDTIATEETEEDVDVNATPTEEGSVILEWPAVENADTYTITIAKNGEIICTLVFDDEGRLISIAFGAPARDGIGRNVPAAEKAAKGWRYEVKGLEPDTEYAYTVMAKQNETVLYSETIDFTMPAPQGIDDINAATKSQKIVRDNQVLILRGDKTYTLTGQEVK
ncbi:MAG: leucine-rich repeat domain-containing protein [Paludibacteraceae bacterium]|nr:leucine-rich repeat domain-containing protein [Paludibacteraceae bacterium]